jgi:hypothetical protein
MFFPLTGDVAAHDDSSKDLVKMQFQAVLAEYIHPGGNRGEKASSINKRI